MQKKLIAMAVAGLVSGAAFAQSNVTIYGVMDATYDNVKADGATTGVAFPAVNTTVNGVAITRPQMNYPGANFASRGRTTFDSSYIGFKGSESIGNGLTAVFQIETGIGENPNGSFGGLGAGAGAGPVTITGSTYGWANRDTMVALAGGFGTIAFGNLTGPTRLLGAVMDPNAGATGIGANTALLGKMGGGAGAGVFDQRIANAIAYISPTFGGFYGVIGYLPNENRGTDAAQVVVPATAAHIQEVTGQTNISAWTFGGVYGNGPILAALTYTKATESGDQGIAYTNNSIGMVVSELTGYTNLAFLKSTDDLRLGFKYDFGMATVGIMWDRMTAKEMDWQGGDKQRQDVFYIPVTVKLGPGKLVGQYGQAGKIHSDAMGNIDGTGAKHFEIGYEYSLSKRTSLNALYTQITNDKNASYDFLYGVSQPNSTAYSLAGVSPGADPKGISIGIRHNF